MHITKGYHTVEDRGDPDYIEQNSPFICTRSDAWLSHGYYFWEKDLKRAHKWGIQAYGSNGYVICQCGLKLENMLDLVGDREHQEKMRKLLADLVEGHPALKGKEPPLGQAIALLRVMQSKQRIKSFTYDSVRAQDFPDPVRRPFTSKPRGFETTDLNPRIQICLFEKTNRILPPVRIVYPEHYVQD